MEQVGRIYINDARAAAGAHDVALDLFYRLDADEDPLVTLELVVSKDFLPKLAELLKAQEKKG